MTTKTPRGITVSFTKQEIEWMYWVVTEVLTSDAVKNSAEEKIIQAYELIQTTEKED